MKLSVIALDYDGTTARDDTMGPLVREAIANARARHRRAARDREDSQRVAPRGRRLALRLVLLFNGGRVMTLPQGVSKATGTERMLQTIRRSPRNMLAIGDVFGDHALAAELRDIEASHPDQASTPDAVREIVEAIRRRYELGRD